MKYVITGINRFSGERHVISRPYEKPEAERMRNKKARGNNRYSVYTRLKLEPYTREGNLFE